MMMPATSVAIPNDEDLLKIAVAPQQRLFPYLNRTSAFTPLILVCCVFPALQLLTTPALDDEAAIWGLRALAVGNASTVNEILRPGMNESGQPLVFQPPLAAWVNGIVVRALTPSHPFACTLAPLVATAGAIWVLTRLAKRIGGVNTALSSAILMCSFPPTLKMAISPSNESIGFLFLLVSVFSFQKHLEEKLNVFSFQLLLGGIAWGLSILTIGPIAFLVPLLFIFHAANLRAAIPTESHPANSSDQMNQRWPVIRSIAIIAGIGVAIGAWWEIMMLSKHGWEFWNSWWNNLPQDCLDRKIVDRQVDSCAAIMPSLRDWFDQHALLIAWTLFGLRRSWSLLRYPPSEMVRRRHQLLLLWWSLAIVGRLLVPMTHPTYVVNTAAWNLVLLAPTLLLASLGIGSLIERSKSQRSEFAFIIALVLLTVYRLTFSWLIALTSVVLAAFVILAIPGFRPAISSPDGLWTENAWRQLLQSVVYVSIAICLSIGIGSEDLRFRDEDHLAELRDRLSEIPEVRRVSLIATRDPIPISLRYLLRCRWPKVGIVTNEGWDTGLTRAMNDESQSPSSRFLVLEWTRRNVHLSVDTFQGWQLKSIGDPMRFHGRRLSLLLIEPQT